MTFEDIKHSAKVVGFDACGVTHPYINRTNDIKYLKTWIRKDLPPKLHYLQNNEEIRYNPIKLVKGARTIIVCLLTYDKCKKDYHRIIKSKLYQMQEMLVQTSKTGDMVSPSQHIFCDSAPILERSIAVQAGLGWIGKNRQLIHPVLGAKTHIGELFINDEIKTSNIIVSSQCGDCKICLEACPNNALGEKEWHADRCIAYYTNKCTACQDVCPYNA